MNEQAKTAGAMVLVPRDLLERLLVVAAPDSTTERRAWYVDDLRVLLAAPAEQPPAVGREPDRSPEDYAIEHAEYMAKSSDDVLAKFQAYSLALLSADEGGDDGEGELFEAIDNARSDLQESLVDLRSMVYEFRKRSSRCTSQ